MRWNKDTLKEARLKANLSQISLADELGGHFRTVQNWEKGTTSIPLTVQHTLYKLLGENNTDILFQEKSTIESLKPLDASMELKSSNSLCKILVRTQFSLLCHSRIL